MEVKFYSNKIYFIVSLESTRMAKALYEDIIKRIADKDGISSYYKEINSRAHLVKTFDLIVKDCEKNGYYPFIHLEVHGSTKGIGLKSGALVTWREIGNKLMHINLICRNNLFVSIASCYGGYIVESMLEKLLLGNIGTAPFFACIGPTNTITYGQLEAGYSLFYSELLQSKNLNNAIATLNKNKIYEYNYKLNTCLKIFQYVVNQYLVSVAKRFRSSDDFIIFFRNIQKLYYQVTKNIINMNDRALLEKIFHDHTIHEELINGLADKFFIRNKRNQNDRIYNLKFDFSNWEKSDTTVRVVDRQ